jgi:hypothetical protein
MSKASGAAVSARGQIRTACVAAVAATIVVLVLPAMAVAGRGTTNSFAGSCTGLEGWASFPEHPLGVLPVDMLMLARPRGGECSGTVNGREIESVPAAATARLRGPQSCGGGATAGRFTFRVAGRRFTGKMTYRRIGSRVTALWEGDGGGAAAVVVRARVGLVAKEHPAAGTPVIGPVISDQVSVDEAWRRCAGEGIPRMPVLVERIRTLPELK